ncbi:hypothetical protein KY285_003374 [Solanum tuberosum]|nr:hypothetical protein KY284_003523 [Solanum tuberosum]KAH0732438.1 hypothetical protein KY289_003626 [Solanum tuberosum]KAH0767503.1 hypothetical protein KY285_003374 [Solanum tuberosum]
MEGDNHPHIQTTVLVFLRFWTTILSSIVNNENDASTGRGDHTTRKQDLQLRLKVVQAASQIRHWRSALPNYTDSSSNSNDSLPWYGT